MAKIKKVGHVVLGVRDPQRSIKFYTEALGMELVNVLEEMQMAFLSFGERDHDIAVIKVPDDQPVGSSGLAHTALEIEGGQEQLRELYERLKSYGAKVEFTVDHVLTKSVYFFDPDGNRLEIFSQEMPQRTPSSSCMTCSCRSGCHATVGPGNGYQVRPHNLTYEEKSMPRINKVGHVVLNVKDVETSVKFYTEALGMEVMRLRGSSAAFLSFGTQHHDIALFKAPEGAEMGTWVSTTSLSRSRAARQNSASSTVGSSNMAPRSTTRLTTA